jgi:hypothetical protein
MSRLWIGMLVGAALSAGMVSGAQAALTISTAPTQNVSCSNGTCTATAASAVLNVAELQSLLGQAPLSIHSGDLAKDIQIDAEIAWANDNGLLFDCYGSLTINRPITSEATGKIVILTGTGGTGGTYGYGPRGRLTFWDTTTLLLINGTKFPLFNSISSLAAAIAENPSGVFALANPYDAAQDGVYSSAPIPTALAGTWDGLGNTLSNLAIDDPTSGDNVGLFATLGNTSVIRNLRLAKPTISAADSVSGEGVGTLVGKGSRFGNAQLQNISVSGAKITGGAMMSVGGLAGGFEITIDKSSFSGTVVGGDQSVVGGLLGSGGSITDSTARGRITGGDNTQVGGIVGFFGSARNSSFSGTVRAGSGTPYGALAGGIIGYNENGTLVSCRASGLVIVGKATIAGGLVGENASGTSIANSSSSAEVTGANGSVIGGFAGESFGQISGSFATGAIVGKANTTVGGFIGHNSGTISDGYALGSATGGRGSTVGGFIGIDSSYLSTSYSIGAVSGETVGGFMGHNFGGRAVKDNDWDTTTSGTDQATGKGRDNGMTGLTDTQLKSQLPTGFDPSIWGQDPNINGGYPYLRGNPPN